MSFTEKKFIALKKDNKIKKTLFAIKDFLNDKKNEDNVVTLLLWLNKYENLGLTVPSDHREWQVLSQNLLQMLKIENQFCEDLPFDNENAVREIIPVAVLLDNVRSPYNAGSILRTCECLGVEKLIFSGITPTPENNKKLFSASKNALIPYEYCKNAIEYLLIAKQKRINVYSVEKTNCSIPINEAKISIPAIIVFGNEEFGIDKNILSLTQGIFHIQVYGTKNSLNVSVAAGIALFKIRMLLTGQI